MRAGQYQSLAAKATYVHGPLVGRSQESPLASAAGLGQGQCELPSCMLSELAPLVDPRLVVLSDVGFGSPWGESLS